ncbi:hypothetical protein BG74_00275 [Sodalis-like endosymbiont of Proechinophthirus fluctus]|nr:hypothetical protein BG74_00275 [Sodalis-like endosymbiont of Proechinophthirus fluctus]
MVGQKLAITPKIEVDAKPGFCHHEDWARMTAKAGGKAVSIEKNTASFSQGGTILIGKVNVIKFWEYRCILFVPAHYGGRYNRVAVHGRESGIILATRAFQCKFC